MELNEKIYIKYTLSPISFENPCEKINCTILVEKKKKKSTFVYFDTPYKEILKRIYIL